MKIVMVLASHDVLDSTGHKTGFWLEESISAQNLINLLASEKAA